MTERPSWLAASFESGANNKFRVANRSEMPSTAARVAAVRGLGEPSQLRLSGGGVGPLRHAW
jgi:hypothetical protein